MRSDALALLAKCFAEQSLEPILKSKPTNPRAAIGTIGIVSGLKLASDEDSIQIHADEMSVLIYFTGSEVHKSVFRTGAEHLPDETPKIIL